MLTAAQVNTLDELGFSDNYSWGNYFTKYYGHPRYCYIKVNRSGQIKTKNVEDIEQAQHDLAILREKGFEV